MDTQGRTEQSMCVETKGQLGTTRQWAAGTTPRTNTCQHPPQATS